MELGFSYAFPYLKILDYWERGITGKGVRVLVIDSGANPHRDLKISGGTGVDKDGKGLNPYTDYYGHGTHVTGIIAAKPNKEKSFSGIAPDVEILTGKYISDNQSNIIAGVIHALNWSLDKNIDIINMSLGISENLISRYPQYREPLLEALRKVKQSKAIMVCAGTNESDGTEDYIDRTAFIQKHVDIIVGNMNWEKKAAPSSGMGKLVSCAGFGTDIWSTVMDNNGVSTKYGLLSGSSMAAPQISGVLALYKQLFPHLSKQELINKFLSNCQRLENVNIYAQGKGIPMPPPELYDNPVTSTFPNTFLKYPLGWENCKILSKKNGKFVECEVEV